jgi:hypothetical protein
MVMINGERIVRHLLTTRGQVNRAFPPGTLIAIAQAIKVCEREHEGEIRFAIEGALHSAALLHRQSARARAIEVFSQLRGWDTEHSNGVLIYVLLAERAVEVVVDRGVHVKVGGQEWETICRAMEERFRRGEYRDGAINGVQAVAQHLGKFFPTCRNGRNELSDVPVVM